jgi:phage terminase large subunit
MCAREFQSSIKDSVHRLLKQRIEDHGLQNFYLVQRDRIVGANGTEFVFYGVQRNVDSIKSTQGVTRLWVEEAHNVSEESWRTLLPTIRHKGAQVWITFNPYQKEDPTSQRWIEDAELEDCVRINVNYSDNPFLTKEAEAERLADLRRLDPATYEHVWNGAYLENSEAQVLHGKYRIAEFEPERGWNGPYHGLDWGFSQDPLAAVKCWIHDETLYVEREAGGTGIELDRTPEFVKRRIPDIEKYEVLADQANPQNISYVRRHGLPRCAAAKKWPGSVEDGIARLRAFKEIIIHPRCTETAREARLYSYKVDTKSGQVLRDIVDAHNHYIDAIRYALQPIIRKRPTGSTVKRIRF